MKPPPGLFTEYEEQIIARWEKWRWQVGEVEHGTQSRYVQGCRCRECRQAWNAYHRDYQRAVRVRKRSAGRCDRCSGASRAGVRTCAPCGAADSRRSAERKARLREAGRCIDCMDPCDSARCEACALRHREYSREYSRRTR